MKQCSVCQEEFADKFSFCPVDGTPLDGQIIKAVEQEKPEPELGATIPPPSYIPSQTEETGETEWAAPSPAVAAAASSSHAGEYHLTIIEDRSITSRLLEELRGVSHESQLTWPEFKRDPMGFVKRSFAAYGQMLKRFVGRPNVAIAMLAAVLSMVLIVVGVAWLDRPQAGNTSRMPVIIFTLMALGVLIAIFAGWMKRERTASAGSSLSGGTANAALTTESTDTSGFAIATIVAFGFVFAIIGTVIFMDYRQRHAATQLAEQQRNDLEYLGELTDIPEEQEKVDKGAAGTNKGNGGGSKPKQDKPGGGGGGGREEQKPASFGKLPQASLTIPQVLAPDPNPPKIKNPSLPVAATIDADPLLFPTDTRPIPYGDPKSKSTDLSSGTGSGNGIGTGTGGGVGSGEGGGVGPGRGGNTGGGDRHEGGGGPGGGGGGDTDYTRTFNAREVSQKARILSKPEPTYTEDARRNQISGTVVLKAVFSSSGQVTNIRAVSSLPHGLTERAISAARQIRFSPAMKDGRPVSQYIQIEYNFNLY
jgi:TonB family protein